MNKKVCIYCPNNNEEEREYVLKIIFNEFLGLDTQVNFEKRNNYKLVIQNYVIIINDSFFSKFEEAFGYLNIANIPQNIIFYKLLDVEVPLIWGNKDFTIIDGEVYVGNDIFATVFFFLTQWEEHVLKKEQGLGIFDKLDENSLYTVRNHLQQKCLINQILEFLKVLMEKCGIKIWPKRHFDVMLTHDVDWCYLSSYQELCCNIYKMLQSGNCERATRILGEYITYRQQDENPFDSFNELMDISDRYGFKNYFYFKPCIEGDEGYTYSIRDKFVVKTIENIRARGHYIGLHATENTPCSYEALEMEYKRLKDISGCMIKGGRTHGLNYNTDIYLNLERLGLVYDSGVGFQFYNGFRASVCYPYSMFCISERKKLQIKQYPFMVMDTVSIRKKMNAEEFLKDIMTVIETVKKYEGVYVTNWHSNMFNATGRECFKNVYRSMVEYLYENGK